MYKILFLLFVSITGCYSEIKTTKKYVVISNYNEIIKETDDKLEAYETAHSLALMNKIFSHSKVYYFVLHNSTK